MTYKNIITVVAVCLMLTGCGLYNKYEQKTEAPAEVFGTSEDVKAVIGESSLALM